jgi:hypothetical protein
MPLDTLIADTCQAITGRIGAERLGSQPDSATVRGEVPVTRDIVTAS